MYKKVVLIIALFALSFPFFIVPSASTAQDPSLSGGSHPPPC